MDRFVILVDAGYLYAAAGELCCGTSKRSELSVDTEKATRFLLDLCGKHCGQAHLRTYWYDGAPGAVPTPDQLHIAGLQGLKLRLGRLTKNGQKGVDSRIVRDLIVLSRNRAAATIYLMSGDEDVREGVAEAQELGVSIVLLGIEALPGKDNQARTLVHEADDAMVLSRPDCSKFVSRAATAPRPPSAAPPPEAMGCKGDGSEWGREKGRAVRVQLEPEEVAKILAGAPKIPRALDSGLIKEAGIAYGSLLDDPMRRAIRSGFWEGFREEPVSTVSVESENQEGPTGNGG